MYILTKNKGESMKKVLLLMLVLVLSNTFIMSQNDNELKKITVDSTKIEIKSKNSDPVELKEKPIEKKSEVKKKSSETEEKIKDEDSELKNSSVSEEKKVSENFGITDSEDKSENIDKDELKKELEYGVIEGYVYDSETNYPLIGANVYLKGTRLGCTADENGYFMLKVPPGEYVIIVDCLGFARYVLSELKVKPGNIVELKIQMHAESIKGDEIYCVSNDSDEDFDTKVNEKDKSASSESKSEGKIIKERKLTESEKASYRKKIIDDLPSYETTPTLQSKDSELDMTEEVDVSSDEYKYDGLSSEESDVSSYTETKKIPDKEFKTNLKAASHNDNQEYPYFLEFLNKYRTVSNIVDADFSQRYGVQFLNSEGKPVFNFPFEIVDEDDDILFRGKTYADGFNYIFPNLRKKKTDENLSIKYNETTYPLDKTYQKITTIQLNEKDVNKAKGIDIVFLIDATGSMGDEIGELKNTIISISQRTKNILGDIEIRWNWVAYRDKNDEYNVRKHIFTNDIDEFYTSIIDLTADGGGDSPENIQAGLTETLKLNWRDDNLKLCFLIGDAESHQYNQYDSYFELSEKANEKGIKIFTLGASGLSVTGEIQFRQMSILTNAEFIFLTYGETGNSDGSGIGKVSHHTGTNYQPRKLDNLITELIRKEASYQFEIKNKMPVERKKAILGEYSQFRISGLFKQIFTQFGDIGITKAALGLTDFQFSDNVSNEISEYLFDISENLLLNYKDNYDILDRKRIDKIIEEHKLSLSGLLEGKRKIGQLKECDYLLIGKVYKIGETEIISMKALQVETGKIVASARVMM